MFLWTCGVDNFIALFFTIFTDYYYDETKYD